MSKLLSWQEIYEKLNIEKQISRTESAEDPKIKFSKFDKCHVSGWHFKDGQIKEERRYSREVSTFFTKAFKILQNWNYEIDDDYYNRERRFLENDYEFKSPYLPKININVNCFHHNLFRFTLGYELSSSSWLNTKDLNDKIFNDKIINHIKKNGDVRSKRELKLRLLLNEI
jgi:hypothetical protein